MTTTNHKLINSAFILFICLSSSVFADNYFSTEEDVNNTQFNSTSVKMQLDQDTEPQWEIKHTNIHSQNNLSAHWQRQFLFDDGQYEFVITAHNGIKFWVDDQLLIDELGQKGNNKHQQRIILDKGYHTIKVEYANTQRVALENLHWFKEASDSDDSIDIFEYVSSNKYSNEAISQKGI